MREVSAGRLGAGNGAPMNTPPRSVRIPDELWQAAAAEAERRGETITDAIVRALKRYVR